MADLGTTTALKSSIGTRVNDNTSQEITPQDVRTSFDDTVDTLDALKADKPTTFLVVTAGTGSGVYRQDGTNFGKALWNLVGGGGTGVDTILWIDGSPDRFRLLSGGAERYHSDDDVADPSLVTTWVADSGDLPLPLIDKYSGTLQEVLEALAKIAGVPPIRYRALLTQTGTDAPSITIMRNELTGTPVASYVGVGEYRITLSGAFPPTKTAAIIQNNSNDGASIAMYSAKVDASGDFVSIVTGTGEDPFDDLLTNTCLLIEVEP